MKDYKNILKGVFFVIIVIISSWSQVLAETNSDYAALPPFIGTAIPPNVLIVLDNSGSMNDQAYATTYDPTQFSSGQYYGLFDATKYYQYNGTRWEPISGYTTTGDPIPASGPSGAASTTRPIASGNFLNWATMSRISVAKKLLIGGKANPRSWNGSVTVKLEGETTWGFQKSYDNTSTANLVAPFTGDYRYKVDSSADLYVEPVSAGVTTIYTSPNGDISIPAGWAVSPAAPTTAYDKVDETPPNTNNDGDNTYIQAENTKNPAMFDYNYTGSNIGSITSVGIRVVAKRIVVEPRDEGKTRRIQGVLRLGGVDYPSSYSNLTTSYEVYSFNWAKNPETGSAWQWSDIKSEGVGKLQAFGVKAYKDYTHSFPRVTQVYLVVTSSTPTGGPYNIIIDQGNIDARGIIDNLTDKARFGLAHYADSSNGGKVKEYVDFGATTNMVNSIGNLVANTWTPLGETLYEMTRYFRQDAPYYSNSPGDYQTGLSYDPYYFNYSDPNTTDQYVPCAKSFILFLTDGESTKDKNIPDSLKGYSSGYRFAGTTVGTTYPSDGTDYLIDVAYWARTSDARPGSCTTTPTSFQQCLPGTQNVNLYSVFMFGTGSTLLKDAAITGGFEDMNGNNEPDCTTEPRECYRDSDGDGTVESNGQDDPTTYFEGDDGYALEESITNAIASILKRSASGTSVSILATSAEGEGALYQAYFYPERILDDGSEREWLGYCRGLFLDSYGNLREDTNKDAKLIFKNDNILQMSLNESTNEVEVSLYTDTDEDGKPDAGTPTTVGIDAIADIWEAGKRLALRDKDTRKVYTWIDSDNDGVVDNGDFASPTGEALLFTSANASTLQKYLRASDPTEAANIIDFTRGKPVSGYRNRCLPLTGAAQETGCSGSGERSWAIGDIVYSTPTVVAVPKEQYNLIYGDSTYTAYGTAYTNRRNVVYVGANDGLLHAFNAGVYTGGDDSSTTGDTEHGWFIANPTSGNGWTSPTLSIGDELWAFAPYDNLPHLKWLTSSDYSHVYYVDLKPKVTDVRLFNDAATSVSGLIDGQSNVSHPNGWGTILIMGMRLGGGAIGVDLNGDGNTSGVGETLRSAYYALDITDPEKPPKLLWRFVDSSLGLTTSYPAVVHFKATETTPEGWWYMVVGSGPDNNVPSGARGYDGSSTQQGKVFIVDIKTGSLLKTFTTDSNAFMGDPVGIDGNLDYNVDVIYIGNVISKTTGKLYRITTNGNPDPNGWTLSTLFNQGKPLLSAPTVSKDSLGNLWVFFGTGRYFDTTDKTNSDQQTFYGIKDACWDGGCATTYTLADLLNTTAVKVDTNKDSATQVSGDTTACGGSSTCSYSTLITTVRSGQGWYINLNNPTTPSERVLSSPAILGGIVLFTSFTPNNDICAVLGDSSVYALYYETGSAYNEDVIGTETIGGTEYVKKSISLGKGMPTTVSIAIGKETKGFIQTSTGTILEVEAETSGGRSKRAGWRETEGGGGTVGIETIYKHIVK